MIGFGFCYEILDLQIIGDVDYLIDQLQIVLVWLINDSQKGSLQCSEGE